MDKKSDNDTLKEGKDFSWGWVLFFFVLLLAACIAYPFILRGLVHWMNPGQLDKYGLVGDMFGALNAFISGCAFIGVIISLYLQRKDLKLQKNDLALQLQEMREARKEAEEQTQQFKEQVEIGKRAQFYDNFYRRLELLKSLSNNVAYDATTRHVNKPDTIREQSGILAWMNFHWLTWRVLKEQLPTTSFKSHEESISAIVAWHKTLITILNDVIKHFPQDSVDSIPSDDLNKHLMIILNSLTIFERNFLILLLDTFEDSVSREVRETLYTYGYILPADDAKQVFAFPSQSRNEVIQIIKKAFSR